MVCVCVCVCAEMYCCGYRVAGPNHLVKLVSTTPPPPYPENAGSPEQTDSGTGLAVCTVNPQAQPTENKVRPCLLSNGILQTFSTMQQAS